MMRRAAAAVTAAALTTILFAVRCGDNPSDLFLDPGASSVAQGVITGVLGWDAEAPYPTAVVYAIRSYDPTCSSSDTTMHVTGTHTGWSEEDWAGPGMTEVFPCFWVEKIPFEAEDVEFKIVNNGSWGGSYSDCDACEIDDEALQGTATGADGGNLRAAIPAAGEYWFLFNTSVDPSPYVILTDGEAPWDTVGGDSAAFHIDDLETGRYTLAIHVPGEETTYPVRYVKNVRVTGEEGTDLGTVSVLVHGAIRGVIAFGDEPAPTPAVSIFVSLSGSGAIVDTIELAAGDVDFTIEGLNEETYDLLVHTVSYVDTLLEAIPFVADEEADLDTIVLRRGGVVTGIVAFADDPITKPEVTIRSVDSSTAFVYAETTADPADGGFLLDGLPPGAAAVSLSARRYVDTTLAAVPIVAAETTGVGTVTLRPGCVSVASTIHILGDFNGWDEGLWVSDPGMIESENCLWVDTIAIHAAYAGAPEFKFVIDGAWGSPPDYVLCADSTGLLELPLEGPVCLLGDGQNIVLHGAAAAGRYEMTLDEDSLWYGATLVEEFTASITGTIAYDTGLEPPFPAIATEVRTAGDDFLVAADTVLSDGTLEIGGLDAGAYDLTISGSNLRDTTIAGVVLARGQALVLDTIVVTEVTCQPAYGSICIRGEFNAWDNDQSMSVEGCTWTDTIAIATSGCSNFFKFVTNCSWDDDFVCDGTNCEGSCDSETPGPYTGSLTIGSGQGNAIDVNFDREGFYRFTLHEDSRTFTIEYVGPLE